MVSALVTTSVLFSYHHQVYLIFMLCMYALLVIIQINILVFVLYNSIFAPLGELKMSVLKMHQSRQLSQEQTATSNSANESKEIRAPPAPSSDPHTTALPPPHTKQPQTVTDQGGSMRKLLARGSFKAENSGFFFFFFYIWPIHVCPKSERDGEFGQRDTKAGFSLGFILDMETSGALCWFAGRPA